jgi:hypothetical protein
VDAKCQEKLRIIEERLICLGGRRLNLEHFLFWGLGRTFLQKQPLVSFCSCVLFSNIVIKDFEDNENAHLL